MSDVVGENLYFTSYYGFRIFFVHLLPCSALVILNLLLFRTLAMARQNRKKLFSRCTAPTAPSAATNSKPVTLINRSNEEHRINSGNEFKRKGLGKRNLRSKLSNAFTTIILSNTSLSNAPKLNGSATNGRTTEEPTSSMPLTEETLPDNSSGVHCANRPNHLPNGQPEDSYYSNPNNKSSERTNQLMAHHISANKTSSSSSIHSYTTTSNQISSMSPSSVYRLQSASLTANGQSAVSATIITNSSMTANGMTNVICTNPAASLYTNSSAINKAVNTSTSAAPSLSLPRAYPTSQPASSNCKLNSDPNSKPANENNLVNGNINYSLNDNVEHSLIDNLVSNQDSAENGDQPTESSGKGTSPDRGLIANKSDIKSESNTFEPKAGNQLNFPANQLRNFNTTEKLNVNKPQISDNPSSSASSSAANVQKSASCKKLNTLECRRQRDNQCTTLMLVVIVSVFLLTEIPLAITTLLHVTQNILDITFANYKTLNSTILFTNFFIMLSYPVNFAIYCGMSRQFRETFKALILNRILCRGKANKKNGRYTTTTNATYSNYECSRQFRHGSVTNQLIANPANVLQIKGRKSTSQQPSDNSTSNQMNNDQLEDESTSQSRPERNSDSELKPDAGKEPNDDPGREEVRRVRKERQANEDRRIRFKTSSFELENCDLNNNRPPDGDVENNQIHSNQLEDDNDPLNRYGDRPPYIETNL